MKSKAAIRRDRDGRRAEWIAACYLWAKGYRIVARRFRCASGEIDVIAKKRGIAVIVEVKKRQTTQQVHDSIRPQSWQRIASAADSYIAQNRWAQRCAIRFDAVYIIGFRRIIHEQDAWRDY